MRVRAGVEAELGDQHPAQLLQRPQRVTLLPGAVLRHRQQLPATLPQRRLLDQSPGVAEDVAVPAAAQRGVHPQLLGVAAQLLEPLGLGAARPPLLEVGQRRTAPQRQGLRHAVPGPLGLPQLQQLPGPPHQPLELVGIDLAGRHRQPVAVLHGLDGVGAQQLAQPDHGALQRLAPGGGRTLGPQRVGQLVRGDRLPDPHRQHRKDHPVPTRQRVDPLVDLQRAQHRDAHTPTVNPFVGMVNGGITAVLPRPHRDDTARTDNWDMTTHHDTEKGTVMTVHTAHPGHHITTKTAGLALAGAVLAVGAGYGAASLVLDEAPASITEAPDITGGVPGESGLFPGTNREERALMHRR